MDDGAYGFKNKDSGEWNGLMGELLAQVYKGQRGVEQAHGGVVSPGISRIAGSGSVSWGSG